MNFKRIVITALLLVTLLPLTNAVVMFEQQDWERREHEYISRASFSTFQIKYRGKIAVSDNDEEVTAISKNGYLKIKKSSFGNDRSIVIESDSKGNLSRKYFEGGKEKNYNPEGKTWFGEILYDIIRISGIGGKERILRIYKDEGISGALEEAEDIYSRDKNVVIDINIGKWISATKSSGINVRNMYMKALIDNVVMDDSELIKYMRSLEDVVSNSTKGTILRTILNNYKLNRSTMEQFLETTATLTYNTERGNTLRAFIKKYDVDVANYRDFFEIIDGMGINSEKGNVLKPLINTQELDEVVMDALLESVDEFTHDAEKAAVLRLVMPQALKLHMEYELKRAVNSIDGGYYLLRDELIAMIEDNSDEPQKYDEEQIIDMLRGARQKDANTRKTPVLRKVNSSLTNNPRVMNAYFAVVRSMDNDMCKYNVLLDLIRIHELTDDDWLVVLNETEDIARSEYYHGAAAVLRDAFYKMPHKTDLIEAFFDVLDDIENDHNSSKEELIRLFCEEGTPDNETIAYLLKTIKTISVDIEKATSLIQISKIMPKDNKQLDILFENVADDIESDYEYERLIKSL